MNRESVQGYGKKKEKEEERDRESQTIVCKGIEIVKIKSQKILTIIVNNRGSKELIGNSVENIKLSNGTSDRKINVNIDISVNTYTITVLKCDCKFLRDIGNDGSCQCHDYLMNKFKFFIIDDGG